MNEIKIEEQDRVLIIAPHPDDESIGVGGLLSVFGRQCDVWVMTDGSKCRMELSEKEIVTIRQNEFEEAMSYYGVNDYRMFGIQDRNMINNLNVFSEEVFDNYNKVFFPSNDERHIDHISTYEAVKCMLTKKNYDSVEFFLYEITNPMVDYNTTLNITSEIDRKTDGIKLYTSQVELFDYVNAARSLNMFRACMEGLYNSYVEVYKKTSLIEMKLDTKDIIRIERDKYEKKVNVFKKWLSLSENKSSWVESYLIDRGIPVVSIYGYGDIGKKLIGVLENSRIKIECIIDKSFTTKNGVFTPVYEYTPNSETVIVTTLNDFDQIRNYLLILGQDNIIYFLDILGG